MSISRFLSSVFAPRPATRNKPTCRLAVEQLEARDNPSGGLPTSNWSLSPTLGNITATAVQPDGKVLAVGNVVTDKFGDEAISVVRMNPNGSLDKSFNKTGNTTITVPGVKSDFGLTVTLQSDGKILVGGSANGYLVARLNANGTLDTTFGNTSKKGVGGGEWTYNPGGAAGVESLSVLPDGSIIGGGYGLATDGYQAFAAFKLTPAGTLDTSFGTGGRTVVHVGTAPNAVNQVAITASGEIVMAGNATLPGSSSLGGCVVALTPAGQLDTNFNGTGYLVQSFGGPSSLETDFTAVAAQGNSIVVAGFVGESGFSEGVVARYTLGGVLDISFNTADTPGYFLTTAAWHFTAVGLEPDGSIALGGYTYFTPEGLVAHLSADGVLDTDFGSSGTGFAYFAGITNTSYVTMAIGPDGSLLLSGWTGIPVHTVFAWFTAG